MSTMHGRLNWAILGLHLGCSAAPGDGAPVTDVLISGSLTVDTERLLNGEVTFAQSMNDGRTITQRLGERGIWVVEPGRNPQFFGGDQGELRFAVESKDDLVLWGQAGFFAFAEPGILPSPLTAELPDEVLQLEAVGEDLWFLTPSELLRWRDGRLATVRGRTWEQVPTQVMAFSGEQVMVRFPDRVEILEPKTSVVTRRIDLPDDLDDLSVSRGGEIWGRAGASVYRFFDQGWVMMHFPQPVRAVIGHAKSDVVWVLGESVLWIHIDGGWHEVEQVENAAQFSELSVASGGELLVSDDHGLLRFEPERRLWLNDDVPVVAQPLAISMRLSASDQLSEISARTDEGAVLPVRQEPLRIVLNPWLMSPGSRRISVTAHYRDRNEGVALEFEVRVGASVSPRFADDLEPLFRRSCAACHDAGASARDLSTREAWMEELDAILPLVESGEMPLPPFEALGDHELAVIRGWGARGFAP